MSGKTRILRDTYCVWNNRTDELVALDLPAEECCRRMGIKTGTFYTMRLRSRNGNEGRWHIVRSRDIREDE